MIKHLRSNILIALLFFATCVSAEEATFINVDEETRLEVPKEGKETAPVTVAVDPKKQIETLRPKLGNKKIDTIEKPWVGYIKNVEGSPLVKRYNRAGDIILSFTASEDTLLMEGDVLDIEESGRAELYFKNGVTVNLGPATVFRIDQNFASKKQQDSSFTLMIGSARVRAKDPREIYSVWMFAPNAAVNSVDVADFAVRYDGKVKTTYVACFDGNIKTTGLRDSKDNKSYNKSLAVGQTMNVVTAYEKDRELYIASEPEKLSREAKRSLLESFYKDPQTVDSWEYTRAATSFARFAGSFEYAKFREIPNTTYANFTVGYVPLIYLGSIFYIEPYFHISVASPFSLFFFRGGGSLQIVPINGVYAGVGGGVFWIHKDTSGYGGDFTVYAGYTFADKLLMNLMDGLRVSYFSSNASGLHEKSFMFSVIINISNGRELY